MLKAKCTENFSQMCYNPTRKLHKTTKYHNFQLSGFQQWPALIEFFTAHNLLTIPVQLSVIATTINIFIDIISSLTGYNMILILSEICFPPAIENGLIEGNGNNFSWTGSVTCSPGYSLIGSSRLKCRKGLWNVKSPVCSGN